MERHLVDWKINRTLARLVNEEKSCIISTQNAKGDFIMGFSVLKGLQKNILFYFYVFMYLFLLCSITVVCIFFPPQPNPPPSPASTLPLGFVHVSFIVPEKPSPHYPPPTPLWLLLDCS